MENNSAPSPTPDDTLLRDTEIAQRFGIPRGVLRNWRWQRRGPRYVRLGASIRYRLRDVRAFLDAWTVDPTQKH